jgi:hypothetical protein
MTRRRRTPPVFTVEFRELPPKKPRPSLRPAREVRYLTGTAPRGSHEEPQDAAHPIDFAAAVARLEGALARGEAPRPETPAEYVRGSDIQPRSNVKVRTSDLEKPRPLAGAPRLRTTKWS